MGREARADPPTGTVTFLLADVEDPAAGTVRSEAIIDAAVTTHGGTRVEQLGKGAGAVAVFESAADAVAVARDVQRALMAAEALDESAVLAAAGDPEQAESLQHEALAIRVDHGLRTLYVDSLDALARQALGAESHAEAARLCAAADAGRELMGYPRPPVDHPDHTAAVARLRASLGGERFATAWSEGAALTLDEAVAYARRARTTRSRPSSGWASLTPTEVEVVRLATDGLTNPEVAARLFMSRNTVKTHLSHVYAKPGVTNRTELATAATAWESRPSNAGH